MPIPTSVTLLSLQADKSLAFPFFLLHAYSYSNYLEVRIMAIGMAIFCCFFSEIKQMWSVSRVKITDEGATNYNSGGSDVFEMKSRSAFHYKHK